MRRAIAVVGSFVLLGAGVFAAVALAGGAKPFDVSTSTDTSTNISTGTSTGTSTDTSTSTNTSTVPSGSKVWLCHRTGSKKHPYHLIRVSIHALQAHLRHGDVLPGTGNSCPSPEPTSTVSTTTTSATTTSSDDDHSRGKHGNKGKHDQGDTQTDQDD
jgi:hypothetical protein